jgi:3-methyladenine DNA glycosylase AlkC
LSGIRPFDDHGPEIKALPTPTAPRKGARTRADVPPDILADLNRGRIETATLPEGLAIDFAELMRHALPDAGEPAVARLAALAGEGITRRMAEAGGIAFAHLGHDGFDRLAGHASDTVRGWAAYLLAAAPDLSLSDRLERIRRLADDAHFGVREWAWLAVRPSLAADLENAVALLSAWTADPSERLRRFASEAIRPRGVWCAHIKALKQNPELALPILEPLRADPAAYVQDSVGNWLNDAAKDRPDWVQALCDRWMRESSGAATARICKRAVRSIERYSRSGSDKLTKWGANT